MEILEISNYFFLRTNAFFKVKGYLFWRFEFGRLPACSCHAEPLTTFRYCCRVIQSLCFQKCLMHCRTLYNYNQWLGDFVQINCQQEVIWLISNFFACFQSAKLSFSKTILFPVVGIDYVRFQYPGLNFVMRRSGFKISNVQPFRPQIDQSRNEVIWSGIDWNSRPTYMNMIKFLIFEDRQSSEFRNDCALSIRTEQENIFFGTRHFLYFVEAD